MVAVDQSGTFGVGLDFNNINLLVVVIKARKMAIMSWGSCRTEDLKYKVVMGKQGDQYCSALQS